MLNFRPSEIPSENTGKRPKLERGSYPAVVNLLLDLGEQTDAKYGEPDTLETKHKMWVGVIFPTEVYEVDVDGETVERYQVLGKEVTFSTYERATLMEYYNNLCEDDSPISSLLGKPCLVTVGHTATGNPKITGINKPMKGQAVKLPKNAELLLVTEDEWGKVDDLDLPPFLIERIKGRNGGPNDKA